MLYRMENNSMLRFFNDQNFAVKKYFLERERETGRRISLYASRAI
jgi:hypothetical protein